VSSSDVPGPANLQARRLRTLLRLFCIAQLAFLVPLTTAVFFSATTMALGPHFLLNTVTKTFLLGLLSLHGTGDLHRYRFAAILWALAGLCAATTALVLLTFHADLGEIRLFGIGISIGTYLWVTVAADGAPAVLALWLIRRCDRYALRLEYLSPLQYRTLIALAEVQISGRRVDLAIQPEDVARNVDGYLASFRARRKWIMPLALLAVCLYPLLTLHPLLVDMDRDQRLLFLESRFRKPVIHGRIRGFWRTLAQALLRVCSQMCYLGYYSDERTHESIGYVPFSRRPTSAERLRLSPPVESPPLRVTRPVDLPGTTMEADVVIIGSGAGGSIVAHGLVEKGRSVLLLEMGDYIAPSTFTESELDMISRLYGDGALQLTRDFGVQILQGSCVGGSTVVNNGVCFRLPESVLARWNDAGGLDAGLDATLLWRCFSDVEQLIGMTPQRHDRLNPGGAAFERGMTLLSTEYPGVIDVISANIRDCLGCGYCNIGCAYGKKLSMLDVVLPAAQSIGDLRIISGCRARRLNKSGHRIRSVSCTLTDGRKLEVRGGVFVLGAGAIASSRLLQRSRLGGRTVGRGLAFNLGATMTAMFDRKVDAYDGLQISHYFDPEGGSPFVLETWFNPPVAQGLAMPGWYEQHYENMRMYDHLAAAAAVVGTASNATVTGNWITGAEIRYRPSPEDLRHVLDGLILTGRAFLEAGALRVMPSTFEYLEFASKAELGSLRDRVRGPKDVTLGTAHPQGGNRLGKNPDVTVVGPDMRVHRCDNLFIADASIFPSSIGVNPQLTVMALARYAVSAVHESG